MDMVGHWFERVMSQVYVRLAREGNKDLPFDGFKEQAIHMSHSVKSNRRSAGYQASLLTQVWTPLLSKLTEASKAFCSLLVLGMGFNSESSNVPFSITYPQKPEPTLKEC